MPRKTNTNGRYANQGEGASMRPRPDAAENVGGLGGGRGRRRPASMRPRPDAAENPNARPRRDAGVARFNEAAARCRGKRAADGHRARPEARFNEAAARCRGKLGRGGDVEPRSAASMRPRPDAAENGGPGWRSPRSAPASFNEAAARCRGKRPAADCPPGSRSSCSFNEAAARCRGKPSRPSHARRVPPPPLQ